MNAKALAIKTRAKIRSVNIYDVIKYLVYFGLMFVFSRARIKGGLEPFGFGFFLSLIFANQNVLIVTPLYIAASFIASPSVNTLIISLSNTLVLAIATLLHLKFKKRMTVPQLYLYSLIGQAGYIYVCFVTKVNALNAVLNLTLGLLFMYACVTTVRFSVVRKLRYRFNKSELACAGIMIAAAAIGFSTGGMYGELMARAIFSLTSLIVLCALGTGYAVGYGVLFGLGMTFATGDIVFAAAFSVIVIIASVFADYNRILTAASVVLADVVFGLFFNAYVNYNFVYVASIAVGAVLFILVPKRAVKGFANAILGSGDKLAARHIVNRHREQLFRRMSDMSGVFAEMERVFCSMVSGGINKAHARNVLVGNTTKRLCSSCPHNARCFRTLEEQTIKCLNDVADVGLNKGRVTLVDIPTYLTSRCSNINVLINGLNADLIDITSKAGMISGIDNSKYLLGEQMGGISKMLVNLAEETRSGLNFDFDKERLLLEELTYMDTVVSEAVIFNEANGLMGVNLVLRSDCYNAEAVKNAASKILKQKLVIDECVPAKKAGWEVLTLKSSPMYDVMFGVAGMPKFGSSASGDTHSFIKIGDDRFMMALCDGMGSGRTAEKISNTAITLVENFYRAGFDSNTVLHSVNKLLSINGDETFTAVDICVINLRTLSADFIKIGAPYGLVKHGQDTEVVTAGSLPMGILDEVRPAIMTKSLKPNDIIVMSTDGITDIFPSELDFSDFVNNIRTSNPQSLAKDLVDFAAESDKLAPHDDMTVIAARVFPVV